MRAAGPISHTVAVKSVRLQAACLFLAAFGLFLATLYPSLSPYRDSGDMAASAYTLGVAHPPGYPLYVLAAKAAGLLLPLGNPAYRDNVLSALLGAAALAALLAFLAGRLGSGPWIPALLAAGAAPAFWTLSQVSEMYTLNALLAALILLCWPSGEGEPGRPELCALLYGLGLGNHQTLILTLPASLWVFSKARLGAARWRRSLAFLVLGLGLYLYLPLRSAAGPVIDWGEPRTWRGFWRVLARADYGGVRLHPERGLPLSPAALGEGAVFAARLLWLQSGPFLLLAAAGLLSAPLWPWAAFSAFLLSGPAFLMLANLDPSKAESLAIAEPHLVLPLVFLSVLAARGLARLRDAFGARGAAAAAVLAVTWLGWALLQGRLERVRRSEFAVTDYARGLLASLPPGAVLLDPDDPTAFTTAYLREVEGARRDVATAMYLRTRWGYERLRRLHPELLPPEELRTAQELYAALLSYDRARGLYSDLPQKFPPGASILPEGLAYKLLTLDELADIGARLDESLLKTRMSRYRDAPRTRDFFTRHAYSYGASALNNLGVQLLAAGRKTQAEALFWRSLLLDPELAEAWNNLGNVRFDQKSFKESASLYRQALASRPVPQFRYNLARALWASGEEAEARKEYAALELPDARNDLGLIDFRAGRVDEALASWEALARDRPDYAPVRYNLGLAYEGKKETAKAKDAYRAFEALTNSPQDRADAEERIRELNR